MKTLRRKDMAANQEPDLKWRWHISKNDSAQAQLKVNYFFVIHCYVLRNISLCHHVLPLVFHLVGEHTGKKSVQERFRLALLCFRLSFYLLLLQTNTQRQVCAKRENGGEEDAIICIQEITK